MNVVNIAQRAHLPENTDNSAFNQNSICEVVKPPTTNGPINDDNANKPSERPTSDSNSIMITKVCLHVMFTYWLFK